MNICHVGATFLFAFFPLEVSETTIPFGLLCLAEQLVPCSAPANAFARLRLFANTVPTAPFKASSDELLRKFAELDDGTPAGPSALLRHAPPIVTRKESRRTVSPLSSAGDEAARARRRRKSKGGLPERKSLLPISNRRPASLLRKMRIRRPEDGAPGIGIVLAMALEKVR
ncbi:hypothetical protein B296_00017620 [Ensete ventricosum]|uniref:Uncharacterized protein n=1 Tax=Ensete ventricosum TaxID=4639 RepID=A0A426ZUF5_ENSVE|nr:hypothetical protein B296_00017620 [Ensete ventricosum]